MSEPVQIESARFVKNPDKKGAAREEYPVHFNPNSLQVTISNTLEEKGKDRKQYVTKTAAKLTMDLVFDTTHDGSDVRTHTQKISKLMGPPGESKNKTRKQAKFIPPVVAFEWGTYKFQGILESYKETLEFFAPNGTPLRAAVNLTMSSQDKLFEPIEANSFDTRGALALEPVVLPAGPGGAADLANEGGDPEAARELGELNDQESLRFPSGPALAVDPEIELGGPVAFATGGAGAGAEAGAGVGFGAAAGAGLDLGAAAGGLELGAAGGGLGFEAGGAGGSGFGAVGSGLGFGAAGGGLELGASAGASFGATGGASFSAAGGAGFGAGAGASFEASAGGAAFGGSASAGVSASAGAFAGLRSGGRARRSASLDVSLLLPPVEVIELATDSGASFQLGGQATIEGSTSLKADVGAGASGRARIRFED
jgi:hypothetical protein